MNSGNLEISTIVGCKMRCSYCPQTSHIENFLERVNKDLRMLKMSLSDFVAFLSTIPSFVDVVFAGMAEPFLNPEATDMIEHAYNKGHKISVYTTGSGVKMQDIERLKNINYHHFCLHLPDCDGLMNLNITDEYLSVLKELDKIKKSAMCIGTLHPKVKETLGYDVPDGKDGLYSRGGTLKELMIPRKSGELFCSSCTEELNHNVLMPNGDVVLCCMDYNQKHVIGNLKEIKYEEIFKSNEYLRVRQGLKDESIDILCRTCEVSKNI